MSCISPISMKITSRNGVSDFFNIPCGHCLNCLVTKQSQLTFLANKELLTTYQKGLGASFVTLTYDDNHLPTNENGVVTLRRKDVQNFIKNMRRQMEYYNCEIPFKYIYCGEYGDGSHSTSLQGVSTCRPHYHIVFIGLSDDVIRKYTRKLWKFGLCDIGSLSAGGIRYVCKYMTKACPDKEVKTLRESLGVQNPFIYHSVGMGKEWIDKNLDKIVDDDFCFNLNGKLNLFPKYVLRYVSAHTGTNYLPYVRKFLKKEVDLVRSKGISYNQYAFEKDYLRYKTLVANLRQQNKPINDITLSKHWCRPYHTFDRVAKKHINKKCADLADFALYGDVVPF